MIVKVQLSLFSSSETRIVLVYNKNRKYLWEGEVTKEIEQVMNGQVKAFFYAKINKENKFELIGKAPWQTW